MVKVVQVRGLKGVQTRDKGSDGQLDLANQPRAPAVGSHRLEHVGRVWAPAQCPGSGGESWVGTNTDPRWVRTPRDRSFAQSLGAGAHTEQ